MKQFILSLNILLAGVAYGQGQSFIPVVEPEVQNLSSTIESFTARVAGGSVYLNWTVTSNDDNHFYLIEKANPVNMEFEVIDIKKGNKSPEGVRLLNCYVEESAAQGEFAYRIRLLGGDMNEVLSPERTILISSETADRIVK